MTRLQFTFAVCATLFGYLLLIFWNKPVSNGGRFILKLSLVNVASWVLFLLFDSHGHPPPQLIVGFVLWLLNSPLLIALAAGVWVSFKSRDENKVFLLISASYVMVNMVMLWAVPAIAVFLIDR